MILPPGIATGILSAPKGALNFKDLIAKAIPLYESARSDSTRSESDNAMRQIHMPDTKKYVDKTTICRREKPCDAKSMS